MTGSKGQNYYEILGVDYDADLEEIRAAAAQLRRRYQGDIKQRRLVTLAWSMLSDSFSREKYDEDIGVSALRLQAQGQRMSTPGPSRQPKTEILHPGLQPGDVDTDPRAPAREPGPDLASIEVPDRTQILPTHGEPGYQPSAPSEDDQERTVLRPQGALQVPAGFLEVVHEGGRQEQHPLRPGKTTIGRKSSNDIVLDDPKQYISRQHAYIIFEDGNYCIVDDDSRNGTRVEGKEIRGKGKTLLADGDTVEIEGRELIFRLEPQSSMRSL